MQRLLSLLCLALVPAVAQPVTAQPSPYPNQPYLMLESGGPSATVRRVVFTPDGRYLLLAGKDKTLRVWDLTTCETVRVIRPQVGPGRAGMLHALAVAPDGKHVAIGGDTLSATKTTTLIYLIALDTGRVERTLDGQDGVLFTVDFSPDSRQVAASGRDGVIRFYDVADGRAALVIKAHTDMVRHVVFAPDGTRLASVAYDGAVRIWSLPSGKAEAELAMGKSYAMSVAWSPDGKTLAVGSKDGCSLFQADGKLLKNLTSVPRELVAAVAFTPDGRELLFTGARQGGTTGLVNLQTGKIRDTKLRNNLQMHDTTVHHGVLSPDGRLAATTGGLDHQTYVWRTEDMALVQEIASNARVPRNVGWALDGKSIRWNYLKRPTDGLSDRAWRAFDLEEFQHVEFATDKVLMFVHQQGTRKLVKSKTKGELQVQDGGQVVGTLQAADLGVINCYAWLPDGSVVLGGAFGMKRVDPKSGTTLQTFLGHGDEIRTLAPSPDGRYFVTASLDMTMRIWSPTRPRPVLSLFMAEPDWIAWTEEGIYAASANGERLMGWQVNHSLGEASSFYPAAQFRRSLHQPDLIRRVLSAGGLAEASGKAGSPVRIHVADVLPPLVAVTSPTGLGTVRVDQQRFAVKAVARSTGKHPVTALRLLVDGRPYHGTGGMRAVDKPALGEAPAAWDVELAPGVHHLAVVAESAVSRAVSAAIEVLVAGSDKVPPNLYVLAAGISSYPGTLRLDFAADDAEAITEAFAEHSRGAFGRVEVKLLKDRQATKEAIDKGLDWLAAKMTSRDVGVLFFSGHGSRAKDGTFFLIPVDVNIGDLAGTCISGEYVKTKMGQMPGRLMAILDACHSGAAGAGARSLAVVPADDLVRDLISEDYGVFVMSSSLGRELSLESPKLAQGYFTHALVQGLSGLADSNKDGAVYLGELDAFAGRSVRQLTRGRQNPVTARPLMVHSFPLARR